MTDLDIYLSVFVGDTFDPQATLYASCGVPFDLRGYTATMTIYNADGTTFATITGTISAPTSGVVQFIEPAATTAGWTVASRTYVAVVSNGTNTYRILSGVFEVIG